MAGTIDAEPDRLDDFLTVAEVEQYLKISRATVYRLLDGGDLEGIKIGSARRIVGESVLAFVQRAREEASR